MKTITTLINNLQHTQHIIVEQIDSINTKLNLLSEAILVQEEGYVYDLLDGEHTILREQKEELIGTLENINAQAKLAQESLNAILSNTKQYKDNKCNLNVKNVIV